MAKKTISDESMCKECMHLFDDDPNFGCGAYPKGIPERYLSVKSVHDSVQPDQENKEFTLEEPIKYPEL